MSKAISQRVTLGIRVFIDVYPPLTVECPKCGTTKIVTASVLSVSLMCGCTWKKTVDPVVGWFTDYSEPPVPRTAIKSGSKR